MKSTGAERFHRKRIRFSVQPGIKSEKFQPVGSFTNRQGFPKVGRKLRNHGKWEQVTLFQQSIRFFCIFFQALRAWKNILAGKTGAARHKLFAQLNFMAARRHFLNGQTDYEEALINRQTPLNFEGFFDNLAMRRVPTIKFTGSKAERCLAIPISIALKFTGDI